MSELMTRLQRLPGWLTAALFPALATLLLLACRGVLDNTHAALLYLPVVVVVASLAGVRAGLLAALLSFLAWDFFFLPPHFTLAVTDPNDLMSLGVFLVSAMTMGLQTGRLREREAYAREREAELALLNRLSEAMAHQAAPGALAAALLREVVAVPGVRGAALFLAGEDEALKLEERAGDWPVEQLPALAPAVQAAFEAARDAGLPVVTDRRKDAAGKWSVQAGQSDEDSPPTNEILLPLQTGSRLEGMLHLLADPRGGLGRGGERLLQSIGQLAAVYFERQRVLSLAAQVEAAEEAARLRTSLVSSVSHELKTPLATVTAIITGLLETDITWDPAVIRHDLAAARVDLERLNDSIIELLDLSRLEGGAWAPQRAAHAVGELLGTVIARLPPDQRRRIALEVPEEDVSVLVDAGQLVSAMQNLVDNALRYSPAACPVTVGVEQRPAGVLIWVEDQGPGLSREDKKAMFEKFYRGSTGRAAGPGTGLGLAIAREIARLHDGEIYAEDVRPHGARFVLWLRGR